MQKASHHLSQSVALFLQQGVSEDLYTTEENGVIERIINALFLKYKTTGDQVTSAAKAYEHDPQFVKLLAQLDLVCESPPDKQRFFKQKSGGGNAASVVERVSLKIVLATESGADIRRVGISDSNESFSELQAFLTQCTNQPWDRLYVQFEGNGVRHTIDSKDGFREAIQASKQLATVPKLHVSVLSAPLLTPKFDPMTSSASTSGTAPARPGSSRPEIAQPGSKQNISTPHTTSVQHHSARDGQCHHFYGRPDRAIGVARRARLLRKLEQIQQYRCCLQKVSPPPCSATHPCTNAPRNPSTSSVPPGQSKRVNTPIPSPSSTALSANPVAACSSAPPPSSFSCFAGTPSFTPDAKESAAAPASDVKAGLAPQREMHTAALGVVRDPTPRAVHLDVNCDLCGIKPIVGLRYKCTVCVDFDLCVTCEATRTHPKSHSLLKMRLPFEAGAAHHPQPGPSHCPALDLEPRPPSPPRHPWLVLPNVYSRYYSDAYLNIKYYYLPSSSSFHFYSKAGRFIRDASLPDGDVNKY